MAQWQRLSGEKCQNEEVQMKTLKQNKLFCAIYFIWQLCAEGQKNKPKWKSKQHRSG